MLRVFHRRKAVALVLVISFLVLLSALVISFFSRVTADLTTSRAYAEGVTVRQLADSAVGVVMGQIREATSLTNAAWASQPGMIRTYRNANNQPGSNAYAFYKLYSSHDLIVSATNASGRNEILAFDPTITTTASTNPVEVPLGTGGWEQQPAYFTDLNAPVDIPDPTGGNNTSKTVKRYPIFDPSVAAIYSGTRPATPDWKVEGSEVVLGPDNRKSNDAPMPVRWMYVLKDGTLTAPKPLTTPASGNTGLIATWSAVGSDNSKTGVPSKENPIVGRIAFWTDDESSKVNVNTAGGFLLPDGVDEDSGLNYKNPTARAGGGVERNPGYYHGSFWDTPRVQTYFDRGISSKNDDDYRGGLANSQPGKNEFQRYPGHPSTTSLGLVFRHLLPPGGTGFSSEKLYAMTPRLTPGGSKNGTDYLLTKSDVPLVIKTSFEAAQPDASGVKPPTYHLFGSVDEMFYTARNGPRKSAVEGINVWVSYANGNGWKETPMKADSITTQMVDRTRFFLTANNRSPELNLFGRPRVTIWPVPTSVRESNLQAQQLRNTSDDLIRFCSTIGRNPNVTKQTLTRQGEFIFDRQDPYSATVDFNLPRNKQIFSYLQELTASSSGVIPGFGGSFETKYAKGAGGRDQILTEIFDYIRTINQKDGSRERAIDEKTTPKSALNNQLKTESRYAPHALVVPTRVTINGKKVSGFGRFPTISEASIVFYHGGYVCRPKKNSPLEKGDLDRGGSARVPGDSSKVVIYDLEKSPVDPANLTSEWAKENVEEWTGQIVRAFVIFETFNPMQGYAPVDNFTNVSLINTTKIGSNGKLERYDFADPNKGIFVHELDIAGQFAIRSPAGGGPTFALDLGSGVKKPLTNDFKTTSGQTWGGRNFGGTEGFFHTLTENFYIKATDTRYYPFQTLCEDPVNHGATVPFTGADSNFDFMGGEMTLSIRYREQTGGKGHDELIQTVKLNFPNGNNWPLPKPVYRRDRGGFDARVAGFNTDLDSAFPNTSKWSTYTRDKVGGLPTGWAMAYSLPSRIAWSRLHSYGPWGPTNLQGETTGDGHHYNNRFLQILQPGDVIRSLVVGGDDGAAADPRVAALQQEVTTFKPHPDYDSSKFRAQTLRYGNGGFYFDPNNALYAEAPTTTSDPANGFLVKLPAGTKYRPAYGPDLVPKTKGGVPFVVTRADGGAADFDTGVGSFPDGAFAGKADEGNVAEYWYHPATGEKLYVEPYFSTHIYDPPLDTYFSPNRQVPGPVMFGSLIAPQDEWSKAGWKTLLFCPNPAGAGHPGAQSPADHLLLDLFTMPVVEPYAISEPFSTAGKVNLNYQMVPFSYIKRTTALRAALHSVRVTAIPQSFIDGSKQLKYKGFQDAAKEEPTENFRYLVDRDETLRGFDAFFDKYKTNKNDGFFKSASQLCERYLYPKGSPNDGVGTPIKYTTGEGGIKAFWDRNAVTGDNVREKPYADLYPRITTKSNTFTVHYRVQSIRQRNYTGNPTGADAYYRTFDESRDQVMSELRGEATIERYLDPEDARFQSTYTPATDRIDVERQSLETAYRFRVISNKRFSPW